MPGEKSFIFDFAIQVNLAFHTAQTTPLDGSRESSSVPSELTEDSQLSSMGFVSETVLLVVTSVLNFEYIAPSELIASTSCPT